MSVMYFSPSWRAGIGTHRKASIWRDRLFSKWRFQLRMLYVLFIVSANFLQRELYLVVVLAFL